MNLDHVVMNIVPCKDRGWKAEQMNGEIIKVEPDNYEFWQYCGAYTLYTRKQYEEDDSCL